MRTFQIFFLYRHVANAELPDGYDNSWNSLIEELSNSPLVISNINCRAPVRQDDSILFIPKAERVNELGSILFKVEQNSMMRYYGIAKLKSGSICISNSHENGLMIYRTSPWSCNRDYNLVFDLDETLVFLPPPTMPKWKQKTLEYVNPVPPHSVEEPMDTPYCRPFIKPFLQLICPYFSQIRVCTLSLRLRANRIINLLDPEGKTLQKNRRQGVKSVYTREDVSGRSGISLMRPELCQKTLSTLQLPIDAPSNTVIIDDCLAAWSPMNHENVVAIRAASECFQADYPPGYINGEDGGIVGTEILMVLLRITRKNDLNTFSIPSPFLYSPSITTTPPQIRKPWPSPSEHRTRQLSLTNTPNRSSSLNTKRYDYPTNKRPISRTDMRGL